ncbi:MULTISPECIES: hypothetical protein [Burkholderia]|uniref:hypothetical protein n=1 Tax=Burkholderia TaxID=32008 RepID=UPI0012D329F4|nr:MULTISPECIES: hypothetical protein [Burkholderia]MBU9382076.1 hypothetical protein [Burkholderia gladioli]NIE82667.1 hypothetical protein [Burkholderia sp. Tr-860]NIF61786.1 hypothetical protein [Burkholderia sp. Cy-647]NIF94945.1 hypothetical protein [Burkholderia sp. Ax-1720]
MTVNFAIVCAAWALATISLIRHNRRLSRGLRASFVIPFCLSVAFLLALYAYVGASDDADGLRPSAAELDAWSST